MKSLYLWSLKKRAGGSRSRHWNREGSAAERRTQDNKRKATPMTIIIDIKPEVQAELSRQAAAHGVDIGAYAASLLEEAAHVPGSKTLSQSQLDHTLQE